MTNVSARIENEITGVRRRKRRKLQLDDIPPGLPHQSIRLPLLVDKCVFLSSHLSAWADQSP